MTNLYDAVERGALGAVRAAIEAGADVNASAVGRRPKSWVGDSVVEFAAHLGRVDIVRELLRNGARNRDFITDAIASGNRDLVQVWLEFADQDLINAPNEDGITHLMHAAQCDTGISSLFVKAGADVNVRGDCNETAITLAAENEQYDTVKLLWPSADSSSRRQVHRILGQRGISLELP